MIQKEDFVITQKRPNGRVITISQEVAEQYEQVRIAGTCNMFDRICVQHAAYELGLFELVNFIEEDRFMYPNILRYYDQLNEYFNLRGGFEIPVDDSDEN